MVFSYQIKARLSNVLKIVLKNDHLIFQREFSKIHFQKFQGSIELNNDPFDVHVYASLISMYYYNANLIDNRKRNILKMALFELLLNAIEHGNCEITFEAKSTALESGQSIFELIEEKLKNPKLRKRRVTLSFFPSRHSTEFRISDQGRGFNWQKIKEKVTSDLKFESWHGRGILMTSKALPSLKYNEKGNEAVFRIYHQRNITNFKPKIFENKEERHFDTGDIVFSKGDRSSYLSYMVSGSYNVMDENGMKYAELTPQDLFIGEMAFLLGNQRTATIQANTPGTLIQLSKDEFIECIKEYPYYGLFLARLLAKRIVKINESISRADSVKDVKIKNKIT